MEEEQFLEELDVDELAAYGEAFRLLACRIERKEEKAKKRRQQRSCGSRLWLQRRPVFGQYENPMHEFLREDKGGFQNFQWVGAELFQELVDKVGPRIARQFTNFKAPLEPDLRIAITLRYLATGDSYKSLEYNFRVANNTISLLIPETCMALYQVLEKDYFHCTMTPEGWLQVAEGFSQRWNYHNCVGVLDGKHVAVRCPRKSGSYNYKHFFSIVLMALVDSDYKFIYADIVANGRMTICILTKETTVHVEQKFGDALSEMGIDPNKWQNQTDGILNVLTDYGKEAMAYFLRYKMFLTTRTAPWEI